MNKNTLAIGALVLCLLLVGFGFMFLSYSKQSLQTEAVSSHEIAPEIVADGAVTSANTAVLHFQTGGKMIALYAKEGDKVYAGQSLAQLDTYPLQQQLTAALNTYRSTRNAFDQTQQNANTNSILQNTQRGQLNFYGAGVGTDQSSTSYLNDVVKRIIDENQANLDNSVISVQLANYALQLATLTTPITGIVTHEDVTVGNVNVTPATTFVVEDPTNLVFRANIPQYQIDFIHVGSPATFTLDGTKKKYTGTISKIYPQKITLQNGQQVYRVDIVSDNSLSTNAPFDQTGSASITSDAKQGVFLLPAWTVMNHQYVWVEEDGKEILKQVTVGTLHGSDLEIRGGLQNNDKVILNPAIIAQKKYSLL